MLKLSIVKLSDLLVKYNFPEDVSQIFLNSGITTLYPPQAEAVNQGILTGNNLLMSVPTAAGKTLIAELSMISALIKNPSGRCLYIAPLKALASEKYNDFKNKYESIGIKVGLAIGDTDTPTSKLNQYQIIIATAEKIDSLLRSKAKWMIDSLSVVVLDEIHFINDSSRGPTMEILIARINQLNPKIQIIALSATVKNADEMAEWLNAKLVKSSWRPIPLKEGVYFDETIEFSDGPKRRIMEDFPDDISKLTIDTLRSKGQVLIFVNSRRSAQAASRQVTKAVAQTLTADEKIKLIDLAKKIKGSPSSMTKVCRKLGEVIVHGCAFHHAGLKPNQRELIETNFKNNLIKVISCTPTLAAGVNLPARRAIIRDCKRYDAGKGQTFIPASEYKQCAGRAGRPGYDEYGEAVLVAKSHSELNTLFDRFILADPEPVTSKLADESSLRMHILASIAGGYVYDISGMNEFIEHTFLHHQNQVHCLHDKISDIFDFLCREDLIQKSSNRYFATPLGALTSRIYIDPMTTITLREGIKKFGDDINYSPLAGLHLITTCPDSVLLTNVGKKMLEDLEIFASHHQDELLLNEYDWNDYENFFHYMSTLKTTWLLSQWIEEEKEESICDQFNAGPGDIYRVTETTQWLLYAAGCIAEHLRKKSLTFQFQDLRNRVRYGIREDILEITRLKGIGRVRARILFNQGYSKINDFKHASSDQLGSIKQIGKSLAKDIITQAASLK